MIPIITFHALGDHKSPVFTSPANFEKQLRAFSEAGYRSMPLSGVIQWLKGQASSPPEKGVVFTFDDGYESVYSQGWPLMERYGFQGTIFVISDYCGRMNQWLGQMRGVPERPLMGWEQLAEMAEAGWELGAHSRTHPLLSQLDTAELDDEIAGSRAEIKRQTGAETAVFATPYGETNGAVDEVIRGHFSGSVSTKLGLVRNDSQPFELPRVDAYYLEEWLIRQLGGPVAPAYLALRQGLRQIRRLAWKRPYGLA